MKRIAAGALAFVAMLPAKRARDSIIGLTPHVVLGRDGGVFVMRHVAYRLLDGRYAVEAKGYPVMFDSIGRVIGELGTASGLKGLGLNIDGILVDSANHRYLAFGFSESNGKATREGMVPLDDRWHAASAAVDLNSLVEPRLLLPNGNVVATTSDRGRTRVYIFGSDGARIAQFDVAADSAAVNVMAHTVIVGNAAAGNFWLFDRDHRQFVLVSPQGRELRRIADWDGAAGTATALREDERGRLWVVRLTTQSFGGSPMKMFNAMKNQVYVIDAASGNLIGRTDGLGAIHQILPNGQLVMLSGTDDLTTITILDATIAR